MIKKQCDITMSKEKNLLIFTNKNFPYQISFDLNTGEYTKINGEQKKVIKCVNYFFANNYYMDIINKEQFPTYSKMIEMAGDLGWNLSNMGSVLGFLRNHLYWEQYIILGIPINRDVCFPLSVFPKDVLKSICKAIKLSETYNKIGIDGSTNSFWSRKKYGLPTAIHWSLHKTGEQGELYNNCWRYALQIEDDKDFAQTVTFFYNKWEYFYGLVTKYNYEYKTLLKYLCFLQKYEGYTCYDNAINDLEDYANMSSKIAIVCDRPNKFEKYPHFLRSRHDIVACNFNSIKKEYEDQLFANQYDGSLNYNGKKLCIIEPATPKDILKEAQAMHNCVASYIDSIIDGTTKIVFLREKKTPDESLVTVEVKRGKIIQAYQQCNTKITDEQYDFLSDYAKNKKLTLDIL